MRILIASNTYWSLINFRTNLIKRLQEDGHDVIALAPDTGLEQLPCPFEQIHRFSRTGGISILSSISEAKRILKRVKADVILSFTPVMNVVMGFAKPAETEIICTINGLGHLFGSSQPRIVKYFFSKLYSLVYKKSRAFIFQNHDDFDELKRRIPKLAERSLFSPGSGVELAKYTYNADKNNETLKVAYFGRFVRSKGIDTFIDIVEMVDGNRFSFILGGGVDEGNPDSITTDDLNYLVKSHNVEYLGFVSNVNDLLKDVDVVIFPSRYREGIPRILLEACASGCAILTTDNVGCRETVIHGENGYFINSAADGVEKLELLDNDRTALKVMARKSREKAENEFDEKIVLDLYSKAVKQ